MVIILLLLTQSMEGQSLMQTIQWHQFSVYGRIAKLTVVPVVILWEQHFAYMVLEQLFYCIIPTLNK